MSYFNHVNLFIFIQRKINVCVTAILLRSHLVLMAEQDMQLAKLNARDFNLNAIDFTVTLVRDCWLGRTPYVTK